MKQASSTDEVLGLLREAADPPVMTARMIADEVGVSKVTAARYLEEVVEENDAQMTTVGRTNIYWTNDTTPTEQQLQDAAGGPEHNTTPRDNIAEDSRPAESSDGEEIDPQKEAIEHTLSEGTGKRVRIASLVAGGLVGGSLFGLILAMAGISNLLVLGSSLVLTAAFAWVFVVVFHFTIIYALQPTNTELPERVRT